ncbi:MAG: hypothetical protein QXT26_09025 [Thermoproteota archaeon]
MNERCQRKIRSDIKEKMMKYKDRVNWAQEIREFIEGRIRQFEAEEIFKEVLGEGYIPLSVGVLGRFRATFPALAGFSAAPGLGRVTPTPHRAGLGVWFSL